MRRRGSEQPPEVEPPDDAAETDEELPVDRLRARMTESLGDRPFTVYLVLFAGAATLLLLLVVVWISATGDGDEDNPFCTEISTTDARSAVLAGQVERINVLVDVDQPTDSLTGIQLLFGEGSCRQTPQGANIRDQLYSVIGAAGLFNHFSETGIDIRYQEQEIQPELLATSTPTVLPTETATSAPSEAATPVESTATVVPATDVPLATATPEATAATGPTATTAADGQDEAPVGNPGA